MASTTTKADQAADADALEQIRELRAQVEALVRDQVGPALNSAADRMEGAARQAGAYARDAADRMEGAARQAGTYARDEADLVAGRVREKPFTWLLLAAGAGYLLGRFAR